MARAVGVIAAAALAVSAFAPLITAALSHGSYSTPVAGPPRATLLVAALAAGLACARRRFGLAAAAGAVALATMWLLLALTRRNLAAEHITGWARPGWAFAVALPAALMLLSLPTWGGGPEGRTSIRPTKRCS